MPAGSVIARPVHAAAVCWMRRVPIGAFYRWPEKSLPIFAAALLIGLADTFGKVLIPQAAGVTVYLLMAAILLWRPEGLFRRV